MEHRNFIDKIRCLMFGDCLLSLDEEQRSVARMKEAEGLQKRQRRIEERVLQLELKKQLRESRDNGHKLRT